MMMRGDMQKIIDHINPVFDTAFKRIEELEKQVKALEAQLKKKPVVKEKAA